MGIRAAAALLLIWALPLLTAAESIREQVERLHADLVALEAADRRLLATLPGREDAAHLRVTLAGALFDHDLDVELIRWGGEWQWASARSPGVLDHDNPIQVVSWTERQVDDGRTCSVRLQVRFERGAGWDRDLGVYEVMKDLDTAPATIELQAFISGSGFTGDYELAPGALPPHGRQEEPPPNPLRPAHGHLTGSITGIADTPEQDLRQPPAAWSDDGPLRLHRSAVHLETLAERRYRDARALAIARLTGVPLLEALTAAGGSSVVRPELGVEEESEVAEKVAPRKRGDGNEDLLDVLDTINEQGAPVDEELLASIRQQTGRIVARVARMRSLVEEHEARMGDTVPEPQRGSDDPGDPDFGPWYGETALPVDAEGVRHPLPEDVGAPGAQAWPCVSAWRMLGPMPERPWELEVGDLPDSVFDFDADYRVERQLMRKGEAYKGPDPTSWMRRQREMDFGYIVPPDWSSQNRYSSGTSAAIIGQPRGIEHADFQAYAEIDSPRDLECWVALGICQRAKLWLDDRLVWVAPEQVDEARLQRVALTRLRFHRGVNRLLLRCNVGRASPFFWMRICTRGQPRETAVAQAHRQRVEQDREEFGPLPVSGYRGDYTGRFEHAHTPAAWDCRSGDNVRWFTPLPYWSNASPALASDRLFVAQEPHWLICLAKDDGRELWRRAVTVLDTLPEQERARGWELYEAWWQTRQQRDALPASVMRPPKWLEYTRWWSGQDWYWGERPDIWASGDGGDEREGASPELLALLDRRDRLEQATDPQAVQEELTTVLQEIDLLKAGQSGDAADRAEAVKQRLGESWKAFIGFLSERSGVKGMSGYWYDYDGHAFATPVTDGQHVWWKNGMDAVACFDMQGELRWRRRLPTGGSQSPTVTSPVLVDGLLIIKAPDYEPGNGPGDIRHKRGLQRLTALDAATGAIRWETGDLPRHGMDWSANTPAPVLLSNGGQRMRVLVTGGGSVVRVEDGTVLVRNMGAFAADASVIPFGDIVVFPRPHLAAYRLIMVDRDRIGCEMLWMHQMGTHGVGYHGSLVTGDGLVCHETRFGHFHRPWDCETRNGPGEDRICMIAKDLRTGELVEGLQMYRKGGAYWSLHSATADHLLMLGGDTKFRGQSTPKPPHHITVFSRGRQPLALARNGVDRCYGGPAFDRDQMYLRGYGGVWCIGYTGAEGRAYEARSVARNLLDGIAGDAPNGAPEPLQATAVSESVTGRDRLDAGFLSLLEDNRAPHSWLATRAMPIDRTGTVIAALQAGAAPLPGIDLAGTSFVTLDEDYADLAGIGTVLDPHNLSLVRRQRRAWPLHQLLPESGTAILLYAELHSDREQVLRFDHQTPGLRAWIGDQALASGDRVRFGEGRYGLLIEIRREQTDAARIDFSPRFYRSDDPESERQRWRELAGRLQPALQRAVELAPDSPEGRSAQRLLDQL